MSRTCRLCQSDRIVSNLSIRDHDYLVNTELSVVLKKGSSLKGTKLHALKAHVCTDCGFVDLFIANLNKFNAAYSKSIKK